MHLRLCITGAPPGFSCTASRPSNSLRSVVRSADDILASIERFCLRTLAANAWNGTDFGIGTGGLHLLCWFHEPSLSFGAARRGT